MKKEIILFLIILVVVGGSAFYAGMKYQQSKLSQRNFFQGPRNLPSQQRERMANREGMLSGEIISKDENSLTLKTVDDSTKIVFFSNETKVLKMTEGELNDLREGKQVMIIGIKTTEGTFLANQIQILTRPPFQGR